uniref:Uncharacterized protein n=1 Tax=Pinctada fucata TaxID=50426 RepID=A0A194ALG8_PINFU
MFIHGIIIMVLSQNIDFYICLHSFDYTYWKKYFDLTFRLSICKNFTNRKEFFTRFSYYLKLLFFLIKCFLS